ncbi:ankyrin repeat and SAM domain-containing protein 6-like [Lytechinus pictus]|uniref:ankyrin repeat and SAM domain-containing protein 6-like n=1 Tax=Lytechinus pictus TaxID=7653 RepID=UPI0030B9C963
MVDGDYHDLPRQLIAACECGDLDAVQQLLDDDAAAIEVDCDGGECFTPLQIAAANGHENVVRLLLMRGAGLDTQNSYGWTALMQATYHGFTNIVVLLLQNKANPSIRNKMGATALTLAAFKGHSDIVNIFLDLSGVDTNDQRTGDIYGPVLKPTLAAIMKGHQAILRQLMNRGDDQFFTDPGTGWTLLMVAALSGHVSAVQYLVDSGCNPNALNINNMTACDISVLCKNKRAKEFLEKKTINRPSAGDDSTESQIIEATEQGDLKLVQRILDKDPMQSNYTSVEGATPLMIAAMLGRRDIAETLVQRGAEINRQDVKSGWTALMQATFHRRKDVVKYLIQAGADLNIQARDGCKALDLALVIVSDETDKVGSELTRLLAPITLLSVGNDQTTPEVKVQENGQMWTTRLNSVDQMEDQEDTKQSGLKAWWSRMSNRFRNLKLTRTLRGGLGSTTKLIPFPDDTARPDETLKSMGSSSYVNGGEPSPVKEGSKHQRRKSKEGSRVSFSKASTKPEPVQPLDMQAPHSKNNDKLLPVIPPFLPPPSFELHNADKSRRSHSKAKGMGPGRPSTALSSNTTSTTSTATSTTNTSRMPRPMFTTRRPGSTGISPSNSAHFSSTISPSSSGEASALSRGLLSARKQGHSSSSGVLSSRVLHGSTTSRAGDSYGSVAPVEDQLGTRKRYASASSVPSLAQIPSSPPSQPSNESHAPTSNPPNRRHSANLTAANIGSNSSVHRPKTRSHSGSASTRGSTSSTLTPTPSPIPMGRGRMSGGGSSHSGGGGGSSGGVQREAFQGARKTSAGSSSISEEDELSSLLKKLSLEKYAPIFEEQEVDMEAFLALNDSDLKEMGIRHKEPRNQILTAITQMNSGKHQDDHDNYSPSMTRYAFQR